MEEQKRHIDDFFREELGQKTEMPPISVWENLEQRLDGNNPKKPPMVWWVVLIVSALFVGGSITAYYSLQQHNNSIQGNNTNSSSTTQPAYHRTVANVDHTAEDIISSGDLEKYTLESERLFDGDATSRLKENGTSILSNENNRVGQSSLNDAVLRTEYDRNNKEFIQTDKKNERGRDVLSPNRKLDQPPNSSNKGNTPQKSLLRQSNIQAIANQTDSQSMIDGISVKDNRSKSSTKKNRTLGVLAKNNSVASVPAAGVQDKMGRDVYSSAVVDKKKSTIDGHTELPSSRKKEESGSIDAVKKIGDVNNELNLKKPIGTTQNSDKNKTTATSTGIKENPKPRDLSAFPEEDAQELNKEEAIGEDFTKEKEEVSLEDKLKKMSELQAAAVANVRSKNPLAASPMADAEIEKTNQTVDNPQANSGGGGGSSSSPAKKPKKERQQNMLFGLKMGYERGGQSFTAGKYVGNFFVDVALSHKLSFVMQPGLKFASANRNISSNNLSSYIYAEEMSLNRIALLDTLGKPSGFSNYFASQRYDSISQTATFKRQYLEIEIPFLFKYKLDKNLSVLAGINFIFGKTPGFSISESKTFSGVLSDSLSKVPDTSKPNFTTAFFNSGANGKSALPTNFASSSSPIRMGYTLGLSYNFNDRLMLDLIIQQNLSGTNNISNSELRKLFDQPYVRFSMGYALFGSKAKK